MGVSVSPVNEQLPEPCCVLSALVFIPVIAVASAVICHLDAQRLLDTPETSPINRESGSDILQDVFCSGKKERQRERELEASGLQMF